MSAALLPALASVAFFVLLWAAISVLLSRLGGWGLLAEVYRSPTAAAPGLRTERHALLTGRASYRNVLRLGGDASGLRLSVARLFRIAHPPLCVPWQDVFTVTGASCPPGHTELRFRRVVLPRVMLPTGSLEHLREVSRGRWRGA